MSTNCKLLIHLEKLGKHGHIMLLMIKFIKFDYSTGYNNIHFANKNPVGIRHQYMTAVNFYDVVPKCAQKHFIGMMIIFFIKSK